MATIEPPIKRTARTAGALFSLLIGLTVAAPEAHAQTDPEEPDNLVHFSYSALLGTGFYRVGDRKVGVLRVPISYQVRETQGRSKPGIRIKIPVTLGAQSFDIEDVPDLRIDDLVTATVMPGVELNFALTERWEVDPSVYIGYGRDISNDESSLIWGAEVTSRWDFYAGQPGMTLGSSALWSGYNPDDGSSDSIVRLAVGLDVRTEIPLTFNRQNLFIGTHAIAYYYPVTFTIQSFEPDRVKTSSELEFGLAIGADPLWTIFGFDINRLGLAYRFSEDTRAVILTTRFPF